MEMGQMNGGFNRELDVTFRKGIGNGAAAADGQKKTPSSSAPSTSTSSPSTSNGTAKEEGAEGSPEAEPEEEVPPFTSTLLKVYGKPLFISQLVMVGYALLLYANPMLLWYANMSFP